MIRACASGGLVLLISYAAVAQAARPEFDVADIRLNISGGDSYGNVLPGGQFMARNLSMADLVQFAYNARANYITGAPAWFATDHFDLVGKALPNTTEATLKLMLQSFLADQFKLAVHSEQKPMDVYALVVGKGGSKLQKAAGSGEIDCKRTLQQAQKSEEGAAQPFIAGTFEGVCKNIKMSQLGEVLQQMAPGYVDRAVVDLTGLEGTYDIKLNWVPRTLIDQGGLTMFDAVDKMLGLKLEGRKMPMSVYVIDHAEKLADK